MLIEPLKPARLLARRFVASNIKTMCPNIGNIFLSGIRLFVLCLPRARAPRSMFEWAWAECAFDMSNISGFMCSVALTMSKHHVNRRYKWIIMNTNLHQFDETLAHILHSQRKKNNNTFILWQIMYNRCSWFKCWMWIFPFGCCLFFSSSLVYGRCQCQCRCDLCCCWPMHMHAYMLGQ